MQTSGLVAVVGHLGLAGSWLADVGWVGSPYRILQVGQQDQAPHNPLLGRGAQSHPFGSWGMEAVGKDNLISEEKKYDH